MTAAKDSTAQILLGLLARRETLADAVASISAERIEPLARLCRDCDVAPWIHAALDDRSAKSATCQALRVSLAPSRNKVRRDNLLMIARAEQTLDRLRGAGIVPIALKGLDLLHRVYASFDLRTADDVDLLVRATELPRALKILRADRWRIPSESSVAHFVRSSHHLPIDSPGEIPVAFELHWNLAQERRFTIDATGLFDRALPVTIGGHRVLRLSDVDLVAHLLLHHFTHYFDRRLKWAIDLQQVTRDPNFDWDGVAERLAEWGATAVAGASVLHLRKLMPELIPDRLLRRLKLAGWRWRLLAPLRSPDPLELFRGTRHRATQLYLAAVLLEHPRQLPSWVLHRATRDRVRSSHPLELPTRAPTDDRDQPT